MRNLSYENEFCMQFHFHANKSHFHKNGFALRLALIQRHKRTRKWPIALWVAKLLCGQTVKNIWIDQIFLVTSCNKNTVVSLLERCLKTQMLWRCIIYKQKLKHRTMFEYTCTTEHIMSIFEAAFSIFQLPIIHSACSPKFCINYCSCEMLLGFLHILKSILQQ